MTDQLPEVQVPDATARFNVPAGAGFVAWFAALRASINVLAVEILNLTKASVPPAVKAELSEQGVVTGARTTGNDEVALSITDRSGRRSWLEVSQLNGGPTKSAAMFIARALTGSILKESGSTLPIPQEITEGPGYAYVVTDRAGRMSELRLDLAGKFAGPFPQRITDAAVNAAKAATAQVATVPIAAFGDSMTAAGSGFGDKLAIEAGVAVRNYGIGGQGTRSIAARQGGAPATAKFPNDTIPASGPVTLTSISAQPYTAPSGTGTSSGHVTIAGVPGTLSRDNATDIHTFTRDAPGAAVWCPPTTPIITDEATLNRDQMFIIWAGRNGVLTEAPEDIVFVIQKMVDYMRSARKRFLVLEVTPTSAETSSPPTANRARVDTLNTLLRKTFPHEYTPIGQYMLGPALADAGIPATAQDTADLAAGVTPTSLRADDTHFNSTGTTLVARFLAKTLRAKGWIA